MQPTFLLVTCNPKKNIKVAEEIRKNHGIKEAIAVMGTYDCIVKTDDIPYHDVKELISSSLRPLDDITAILALYTTPPEILPNQNA